jgi:hypothetical protein
MVKIGGWWTGFSFKYIERRQKGLGQGLAIWTYNGSAMEKFLDFTADRSLQIGASAANHKLGFFGSTPINKPSVTGSRGGNAALTSLMTQLANLGIVTDSTS